MKLLSKTSAVLGAAAAALFLAPATYAACHSGKVLQQAKADTPNVMEIVVTGVVEHNPVIEIDVTEGTIPAAEIDLVNNILSALAETPQVPLLGATYGLVNESGGVPLHYKATGDSGAIWKKGEAQTGVTYETNWQLPVRWKSDSTLVSLKDGTTWKPGATSLHDVAGAAPLDIEGWESLAAFLFKDEAAPPTTEVDVLDALLTAMYADDRQQANSATTIVNAEIPLHLTEKDLLNAMSVAYILGFDNMMAPGDGEAPFMLETASAGDWSGLMTVSTNYWLSEEGGDLIGAKGLISTQ
jgi:hypothetical protein